MDSTLFSPLIERALRVAARCHRNHHRKASDIPYVTHLAGVTLILSRAGFDDPEILAAALLHDTVEDTSCTLEQIQAEFPPAVVAYVAALTERKQTAEGAKRSWHDRKQEHIEQVRQAPLGARAISLADKLHNLGTMLYDLEAGDELWSRFGAAPERIVWYHHSMIDAAAQDDEPLQPLAAACRELLAQLAATVERGSAR
jgi:(p)ppGpp synthase/HD superfamily hydrolase